mmetsp:Transcript_37043/g.60650  ORF Transcript_37043/g.60650 Transcript_37043/m.60650 type:complete len:238 (-) Transcript_37043:197-910(-)
MFACLKELNVKVDIQGFSVIPMRVGTPTFSNGDETTKGVMMMSTMLYGNFRFLGEAFLAGHLHPADDFKCTTTASHCFRFCSQRIRNVPIGIAFLGDRLLEINLAHNNISVLTKHPLALCKNLKCLNLSHNQLKQLPGELLSGLAASLEVLLLEQNLLQELPAAVGELTRIRHLAFGHNRLQRLPPTITRLVGLEILEIQHNMLSSLPPKMGLLLLGLKILKMDDNPLYLPLHDGGT